VPTNGAALKAFYYYVERIWLRTLRRRRSGLAIDQRGAEQSDGDDRWPLMFLDAEQRHKGENAALAIIVDAHRQGHIYHGRDDDEHPNNQRENTDNDVGSRRASGQDEDSLERIKRARADVAKDDSEGGQAIAARLV
jgi:hypothetical protein